MGDGRAPVGRGRRSGRRTATESAAAAAAAAAAASAHRLLELGVEVVEQKVERPTHQNGAVCDEWTHWRV